ncbi:MAG: tRNA epoxyqueuosine(34) reductase QueG [Planctomycetota bacterium]|nr:MAG: tRNA epoxyqueuosine(34) reductase QueG [Planctomycetota bacterium]
MPEIDPEAPFPEIGDGTRPPLPDAVQAMAAEVGLELRAGLPAEALKPETQRRLTEWLDRGYAGGMDYLDRAKEALVDPKAWKPWAGTILLFALPYARGSVSFRNGGRVARYAAGRDYHNLLGKRLQRLGKRMRAGGLVTQFRAVTDAGPILEREWAVSGGLGFRGKNTLLIHPRLGPWQLLGEVLVDARWQTWRASATSVDCGTCDACLEICPTGAFPQPYLLDARRCLSYLSIEHRGSIPREHRRAFGDWVFGCDLCLEVCPFGSKSEDQSQLWGQHAALHLTLEEVLSLSKADFRRLFRGSPMQRPGWAGFLRNACIVLGNLQCGEGALRKALHHAEPLVRCHAAWALAELGSMTPLQSARKTESDPEVIREIDLALDR